MRAVALLSGGLDSTLAIRVMQDQDVEVHAINFMSLFCTCTPKDSSCAAAKTAVDQLGVPLKTVNTSEEFVELVKDPPHGYGSEVNPCLDCRIMMFRKAREYMEEVDARFLVTGEVLGERPMSQRREAMNLIEEEADVEGLVVRPLCAQHMEPSMPEEKGWVDRDQLLDIHGRNRTPQMELADEYDINDYPCPAGGCRLTDPGFASRVRDLLDNEPDFGVNDMQLLKVGRHFRLSPDSRAVIGRDQEENGRLWTLCSEDDTLLQLQNHTGPTTLLRGALSDRDLEISAALTARYGNLDTSREVGVSVLNSAQESRRTLEVEPAGEDEYRHLMVTPNGE